MTTSRQFFDPGLIHRIPDAVSACLPAAAQIFDELERASADGAAMFTSAGIPPGMILVRNAYGSHNADGSMDLDDSAEGCRILVAVLAKRGCQR